MKPTLRAREYVGKLDGDMKRIKMMRKTTAILIAALAVSTAAGCDTQSGLSANSTTTSSSTPITSIPGLTPKLTTPTKTTTASMDFTKLLLEAQDISTADDPFTVQSTSTNPNGQQGAEVLLVNQNQTRAVNIMVLGFPNADGATAALNDAKQTMAKTVAPANPQTSPVGTGGTFVAGKSADGTKSVTILVFSQGSAFARIEFDGLPGEPATDAFVTDVGQKQAIALRVGLHS